MLAGLVLQNVLYGLGMAVGQDAVKLSIMAHCFVGFIVFGWSPDNDGVRA